MDGKAGRGGEARATQTKKAAVAATVAVPTTICRCSISRQVASASSSVSSLASSDTWPRRSSLRRVRTSAARPSSVRRSRRLTSSEKARSRERLGSRAQPGHPGHARPIRPISHAPHPLQITARRRRRSRSLTPKADVCWVPPPGRVATGKVAALLLAMEPPTLLTAPELTAAINSMDDDHNGYVEIDELLAWCVLHGAAPGSTSPLGGELAGAAWRGSDSPCRGAPMADAQAEASRREAPAHTTRSLARRRCAPPPV